MARKEKEQMSDMAQFMWFVTNDPKLRAKFKKFVTETMKTYQKPDDLEAKMKEHLKIKGAPTEFRMKPNGTGCTVVWTC